MRGGEVSGSCDADGGARVGAGASDVRAALASGGTIAGGAAAAVVVVSGAGATAAQQPGAAGLTRVSGAQHPWSEATTAAGRQAHGTGSVAIMASAASRAESSERRLRPIPIMGARFAAGGQERARSRRMMQEAHGLKSRCLGHGRGPG